MISTPYHFNLGHFGYCLEFLICYLFIEKIRFISDYVTNFNGFQKVLSFWITIFIFHWYNSHLMIFVYSYFISSKKIYHILCFTPFSHLQFYLTIISLLFAICRKFITFCLLFLLCFLYLSSFIIKKLYNFVLYHLTNFSWYF